MSEPKPGPPEDEYTIGWICVLQEEYEAAIEMLDESFAGQATAQPRDNNTYMFGRIGGHYVIIGCLPYGSYGTNPAARVATDMIRSFPNLRFTLLVGIGGGAPTEKNDIRLGDVVVGVPGQRNSGVIQLDAIKLRSPGLVPEIERWGQLQPMDTKLQGVIPSVLARYNSLKERDYIQENMQRMQNFAGFDRPTHDELYRADYPHQGGTNCDGCSHEELVDRPARSTHRAVMVHYGTIGSSNTLLKSASVRDSYAKEHGLEIMCFEMEAAGILSNLPCLVIRGICDYADSHKNDDWHKYAALAAAAYAREFLIVLAPEKVKVQANLELLVLNKVQKLNNAFREDQKDRKTADILSWIVPDDDRTWQEYTHAEYYGKRHPGTGEWFEKHPTFLDWVDTKTQTLLCRGPPGAGKSVIASIAINHLQSLNRIKDIKCAYLYCNHRRINDAHQTATRLLSILLRQLCAAISIPETVEINHMKGKRLSSAEISAALSKIALTRNHIYIVVDALDECSAEAREELLSVLLKNKTMQLMLTSRVDYNFEKRTGLHFSKLDITAAEEDVQSLIKGGLVGIAHISRESPLRDIIPKRVAHAAGSLFLLARLYLETLKNADTEHEIEKCLKRLQKGKGSLSKAYEETIARINKLPKNQKRRIKCLLSWVLYSQESLNYYALRHALSLKSGHTKLRTKDMIEVDQFDEIIARCQGLVTFSKEAGPVVFAHSTIRQYLSDNSDKIGMHLREIALSCVTYLSFKEFKKGPCLTKQEFDKRLSNMPLYEYAASHWGHHARTAGCETDSAIIDFSENTLKVLAAAQAMEFDKSDLSFTILHMASHFGLSELLKKLIKKGYSPVSKDSFGRTPLLMAAKSGSAEAVSVLLQANAEVNVIAAEMIMPAAAYKGQRKILRLLLKNGGKIEETDDRGRTLLHIAVKQNHYDAVRLLVRKGANIEETDPTGRTALHYAVSGGRADIVQLLVDKGAEINRLFGSLELSSSTSYNFGVVESFCATSIHFSGYIYKAYRSIFYDGPTLLNQAVISGNQRVVDILIQNGADVNEAGMRGMTPLLLAVYARKEAIARILISHGANVNARSDLKDTPLHLASMHGYKEMVDLLIGANAELHSTSSRGTTVLHSAVLGVIQALANQQDYPGPEEMVRVRHDLAKVQSDHGGVIKLLIEKGTDINVKDDDGETALGMAIVSGFAILVDSIFGAGGSIDTRTVEAAFDMAAKHNQDKIVTIILKYMVNFKVSTKRLATFRFYVAAIEGQPAVIDEILDSDKSTPVEHIFVKKAFLRSAHNGHDSVVRAFLERGQDPNVRDDEGQTAINLAAQRGHKEVSRILVDAGADINTPCDWNRTPLWWAAENGHDSVVEFLLHSGASVEDQSFDNGSLTLGDHLEYDGGTALTRAAMHGWVRVTELLLQFGADANSMTGRWRLTVLFVAVCNQHLEVARMLLKAGADVDAHAQDIDYAIDKTEVCRRTVLHWAASKGQIEMVKLLVEQGANLHLLNPFWHTALDEAVFHGHESVVSNLLEYGALASNIEDYGKKMMFLALDQGQETVAELLLHVGAVDPDVDNGNLKRTILHRSAERGYQGLVRLLLEKGAKVNSRDKNGKTPLHLAANYGFPAVEILLENKDIDVNAEDDKGATPLHYAAGAGFRDAVMRLVTYGARCEAEDNDGRTPRDRAIQSRHDNLIDILKPTLAASIRQTRSATKRKGRSRGWNNEPMAVENNKKRQRVK